MRDADFNQKQKDLIAAYKNTCYKTYEQDIQLFIGERSEKLDILLGQNKKIDWCYITAWNPEGKMLSADNNKKLYSALLRDISEYTYLEGEGCGIDTEWPPEKSVLIMGISKEKAIQLGNKYQQNAIVIGTLGGEATLELLDAFKRLA